MNHRILFGLTGSIACYKVCEAISTLTKEGFQVDTTLSAGAQAFIGASTLEGLTGAPPFVNLYEAGRQMDHIQLARKVQLIVVAPASANSIAKLSHGFADDPLTAVVLANNMRVPVWIAPAMNVEMYKNPATQQNFETLRSRGFKILESPVGELACGEYGAGRLLEPASLVAEIKAYFESPLGRTRMKEI